MSDADVAPNADLALDEVRRGLAEQNAALESLRNRAVGLLAVVSLAAGLGVPRADGAGRVVLTAVVLLLLGAIGYVLAPRKFSTTVRASVVLDDPGWRLPKGEAVVHVVRYLGDSFDANEKTLGHLNWCFLAGMVLTGVAAMAMLLLAW